MLLLHGLKNFYSQSILFSWLFFLARWKIIWLLLRLHFKVEVEIFDLTSEIKQFPLLKGAQVVVVVIKIWSLILHAMQPIKSQRFFYSHFFWLEDSFSFSQLDKNDEDWITVIIIIKVCCLGSNTCTGNTVPFLQPPPENTYSS